MYKNLIFVYSDVLTALFVYFCYFWRETEAQFLNSSPNTKFFLQIFLLHFSLLLIRFRVKKEPHRMHIILLQYWNPFFLYLFFNLFMFICIGIWKKYNFTIYYYKKYVTLLRINLLVFSWLLHKILEITWKVHDKLCCAVRRFLVFIYKYFIYYF